MLVLAIDTSTNVLSLALVQDGTVLACLDEPTKNNQSAILLTRIEILLTANNFLTTDLTQIAVAIGPGSYTGIRVGVAAAKSLGYALGIPVQGVSSLAVMAKTIDAQTRVIIPMIDARRGTVFAAAYNQAGEVLIEEGHFDLVEFLAMLPCAGTNATFIGDGAQKNIDLLNEKLEFVLVIPENELTTSKAVVLAELAHKQSCQKNIHELVPNYLRKTEAEMNVEG